MLDDFNRADNASLGANWTELSSITTNRSSLVSNEAKATGGNYANMWQPDTFGGDFEVSVRLRTIDTSAHVWLLAQIPDPADPSFTGYLIRLETSTTLNAVFFRGNSGSFTTVGTFDTGVAYSTGDVIGFKKVGDQLSITQNGSPVGTFSGSPSLTDPAPLSASGTHIGFGGANSSLATIDDFDGADLSSVFAASSLTLTLTVTTAGTTYNYGASSTVLNVTVTSVGTVDHGYGSGVGGRIADVLSGRVSATRYGRVGGVHAGGFADSSDGRIASTREGALV